MTMLNLNITFTNAACVHIKKKIADQHGVSFRLTIKKTGCSGFSYAPAVVEKINPTDITFEIESGIKISIDPTWAHLFEGLKVDFVEEEKSGLKQKRLIFINPNEASRCGCGESFHVE